MTHYLKAMAWAAAIILVAIGSRWGLYGEDLSDALMMAVLVMWAAVGMPRNCASRTTQGN
jgi:hypothetical protein